MTSFILWIVENHQVSIWWFPGFTSLHAMYATLDYKSNFVKLENLVLIGGPDDGVITPWQSRYVHFFRIYFTYFTKLLPQSFRIL